MCNFVKTYNITMYLVNEYKRKPNRKLSMDNPEASKRLIIHTFKT